MPAYLLVDTAIENADEYEKYKALVKPIAEQTPWEQFPKGHPLSD